MTTSNAFSNHDKLKEVLDARKTKFRWKASNKRDKGGKEYGARDKNRD